MEKLNSKTRFFKPTTIMISLAIVFFFGNSINHLMAAENDGSNDPQTTDQVDEENVSCQKEMTKFINERMTEFREWMERHFQNKSSTASLLTDGMGRFKELRTVLYNELYTYSPQKNALLLTEGVEGTACRRIVDTALNEAKRELETRSRTTSAVKKSTILLTKYQNMNDKLAKLTRSFLTMKAHLDTFAAKLPCFIDRSCNKG